MSKLSLSAKIVVLGIVLPTLLVAILFVFYYFGARQAGIQAMLAEARDVCLATEAVREGMEDKWQRGVFNAADLRKWADAGEMEKVLSAVPVVSAWEAAKKKQEEAGYEFRTPKNQPRNARNTPDPFEAEALAALEGGAEEYWGIDKDMNAIRYLRPIRLTESCMLCHGDPATSQALWGNSEGKDPTGVTMENWKVGEVHGAFETIFSMEDLDRDLRATVMTGALIVVVGLVLMSVIFVVVIRRQVSRPVLDVSGHLLTMADGNFTHDFDPTILERGDEMGAMARAMAKLNGDLRKSLGDVRNGVSTLASASTELTSIAQGMTRSSADTSERATMVAAAAEEMSANSMSVASGMELTAHNLQSVAAATEEMTATMGDVAGNTEKARGTTAQAVQQAAQVTTTMRELGRAAQEIGKVTETITSISNQTNLLALNATIEAARAGAAGKGFAVVATEIKELAQQTAMATEEIKAKITGIQSSTRGAVSDIEAISNVIRDVSELVGAISAAIDEQSVATRDIAMNISQGTRGVQEANDRVAQTAEAALSVARDIAGVDQAGQEMNEGSSQVHIAASELSRLAEQLQAMLARFKV
ncbi:MAG: methyl-accepting chemotaxis protein [Candidatus Hydrogenedentes bacterium]|nr:methyl-accepting chemotaxis protein [Candidatus Hydrogenedentota bacterium]